MTDAIVVLITTPSSEVGSKIATELLDNKLAACVNIASPITSIFRWKGKVEDAQENLLIVKTKASLFSELEKVVKMSHPYECPEIIAIPIVAGSSDYLNWLNSETEQLPH